MLAGMVEASPAVPVSFANVRLDIFVIKVISSHFCFRPERRSLYTNIVVVMQV
jgi:hypothetical protein